ncbi:MAG: hypothetical protein GX318_07875 [Clostridia bacterium]|nr:hypothetical protein [Clostridia bacterium]
MSERVPEKIVEELKKAARSRDVRAFDKAVNKHKRDLPDDLLEATEDREVLEETMKLFNENKATVCREGVRLNVDNCGYDRKRYH